ncbi:DEAD/DEAH box helicase [Candidatus Berkelbacteria bacterium]|nr:DEAD/DEAH box helicase [Candidatus Berkelbacteria bacterium]
MSFRGVARFARPRGRATFHGRPQGGRAKFTGQYISPDRFVRKAVVLAPDAPSTAKHRFVDFGLVPQLAASLVARGYLTPTPIQDEAIPQVLAGRDVIGLANTGTGKTAAFILPLIHRLKSQPMPGTALIVTPTRELAAQIDDEFTSFARGLGLRSVQCVGGMSMHRQIKALAARPQLVVGTPGRLKDLLEQRVLRLGDVRFFVLDEADRMLDMGFLPVIRLLVRSLPRERQSLGFSATMTPKVRELLGGILTNPVLVSVGTGDTSANVEQDVIRAGSTEQKLDLLAGLLRQPAWEKVLIFGQTKWGVQKLAQALTRMGLPAEAIHGNKSQPQRQRALDAFKAGRVMALVATDVAARGLDIPNVSHVINYDQPMTYDDYIHRIGRTGRAGKRGYAFTFVT